MSANPELKFQTLASFDGERPSLASRVAEACKHIVATMEPANGSVAGKKSRLVSARVRPAFSEAFRLLALNIREIATRQQLRSILVMSAFPGEGRSMTVANLGVALANMGSQAVALETDARKPSLGQLFGRRVDRGIQRGEIRPLIAVDSGTDGLVLLLRSSPRPPGTDTTLLPTLLASLDAEVDYVLLDSPACLAYADAFFLATLVDGVIYVVRRRHQDVAAQRDVQAQLSRLGINLLGVVYNED